MKKKKLFMCLVLLMIGMFTLNISAKADEEYVAQIGDTKYLTLDEAVLEASDGDIVYLLSDASTEGLNLNKDLTITSEGENHYVITFTKYGIALWGKSLTFSNVNVIMEGIISTPYTAEWNWMTICASQGASLNLINVNMLMDAKEEGNPHAIYFCSDNKLNLTDSNLIIKNYKQDALEWDGGDGGYNVNIINSTFISDHNRSGFTGTFTALIDNSKVDVINNTGNGSNGSNFEIINNSIVNFNNNGSHGLSAADLTIDNSTVTSDSNGANGVHVTGTLEVKNNSVLTITHNDCSISSKWTIPGALYVGNIGNINASTKLLVADNNGSGIYVKTGATLNIETGTIVRNIAKLLGLGGGINNNGTLNISEGVEIFNNRAEIAGDDIYSTKSIILPEVVEDESLIISREDNAILNDCDDKINGWYEDMENNRWEAHGSTLEEDHIVLVESNTYEGDFAIKAAHDKIKGSVTAKYVDTDGNELSSAITTTDVVGEDYKTEAKDIYGYKLVRVDGEEEGKYIDGTIDVVYVYDLYVGSVITKYVDTDGNELSSAITTTDVVGENYKTTYKEIEGYKLIYIDGEEEGVYIDGNIYVTYYYDKNVGTGNIEDIMPPKTGVETSNIKVENSFETILYKKEDE